jgi:hypothetical protein
MSFFKLGAEQAQKEKPVKQLKKEVKKELKKEVRAAPRVAVADMSSRTAIAPVKHDGATDNEFEEF